MANKLYTKPAPNVELCRDIYGFTVRPQHFQTYKQYADIYTEEEEERSARWERFLETYSQGQMSQKMQGRAHEEVDVTSEAPRTNNDGERKMEMWGQVRPTLWPVEQALGSRHKKFKKRHSAGINNPSAVTSSGLASFKEAVGSPTKNSVILSEDDSEEFYDMERSDGVANDGTHNANALQDGFGAANNGVTNKDSDQGEEEPCPWKEELGALVQGGVPMALRGEVWQVFVGTKSRRISGHYQALLTLLADGGGESDGIGGLYRGTSNNYSLSDAGILEKWTSQIEKDLPRTFPGHPALDDDGRDALRRLLTAYARHNPDVGYCQAMNFFAALLLLLMPEENAFWTLTGFIDDYFEGYYSETMLESQVDQLVLDDLVRRHFPRLASHLDTLGVQVAWVTGPWFLSIFVNILPWESVLRVWDVLLYDGNRSMLFRTALALFEQHGSAITATKDAGDAVTMLQSLAGSTFDSSQLVLIACTAFQSVNDSQLQDLCTKNRPQVLAALSERLVELSIWSSTKRSMSSKVYTLQGASNGVTRSSDNDKSSINVEGGLVHEDPLPSFMNGNGDKEVSDEEGISVADLIEQVKWLKVELSRALVECRAANLRADELETAFMELVKGDNRRLLAAKLETLEDEVAHFGRALADKEEQEQAMVKVMLQMEQEQQAADDARRYAEDDAGAQRHAANVLQAKYEAAVISLAEMEKRTVMAESMLEATLQYQALDNNAPLASPKRNDNAASHGELSRWSWPRLSLKVADLPSPPPLVGGADTTDDPLKSRTAETPDVDSQRQGSLARRFSLGWREKSKEGNGTLECEGHRSPPPVHDPAQ